MNFSISNTDILNTMDMLNLRWSPNHVFLKFFYPGYLKPLDIFFHGTIEVFSQSNWIRDNKVFGCCFINCMWPYLWCSIFFKEMLNYQYTCYCCKYLFIVICKLNKFKSKNYSGVQIFWRLSRTLVYSLILNTHTCIAKKFDLHIHDVYI